MNEIWKELVEFNGNYLISNLGRIKCAERKVAIHHGGYRIKKERILKTRINNTGYESIKLRKDGKYVERFIHRLVAEAFIPNPNNYPIVNHKDENTANNTVENLEWCTYIYNNNYGNRNKKISQARKGIKFTDEHIENMRKAGKNRVNDEFREKMRNVHLGTKLSDEHKKKISEGVKNHYKK